MSPNNPNSPQYRHYMLRKDIIRRCDRTTDKAYRHYGGRGIKLCARWRESLDDFIADMGPIPVGMSIDRINNDGDYEPGNCRWATSSQQQANTRRSRRFTHNGVTLILADWERRLGLSSGAIWHRLRKGWTLEKTLTTPSMKKS